MKKYFLAVLILLFAALQLAYAAPSKTNMDRVKAYFIEQGWKYSLNEKGTVLNSGFNVEGKLNSVRVFIDASPDRSYVKILGVCPLNADKEKRAAVSEYLTRANFGLNVGCFELDLDDGEIRYKITLLDYDDAGIPKSAIDTSLDIILAMYKRYGNGLVAVMMGSSDPRTEISKAEAK